MKGWPQLGGGLYRTTKVSGQLEKKGKGCFYHIMTCH